MTAPAKLAPKLTPKMTPMLDQYLRMKEEHPGTLLFYRMGDFYELFFEDAEIAARELGITLTCRNPNAEVKVPMAGVPHHAVEGYLAQLLEKGFRVAICDQMEDPKQAKGLVKRAVTRVLTPGTVVEDSGLTAKESSLLAALVWNAESGLGGLGWLDFSTGRWSGFQTRKEPEIWQWAAKMEPRELLLPMGLEIPRQFEELSARTVRLPLRPNFDSGPAARLVLDAQKVPTLDVLELANKPELLRALGAMLRYASEALKRDLEHLGTFTPLDLTRRLILDEVSERNLEIFRTLDGRKGGGTLLGTIDRTLTPMGGRLLFETLKNPWREAGPILESLDAVGWLLERADVRRELRESLRKVADLERLSTRIFLGRAAPRDFAALRESLRLTPRAGAALRASGCLENEAPAGLRNTAKDWDDLADVSALLERALVDNPPVTLTEGGLFRAGYDPELDELLELSEQGEEKLKELHEMEKARSGLPSIKLGYNRVFGYYFEISRGKADKLPDYFIRRQSLAGAERFVTPELKELEEKLLSAEDRRKELEYKLFLMLRESVTAARPRLMRMAGVIARLDVWLSHAEIAATREWVRPRLSAEPVLTIRAGRHPVVEASVGQGEYVPSDVRLDENRRIMLITGPNMGGKSTVLRMAACVTLLAQAGCFVPATEAEVGLCDRIFTRVGASDNLAKGHSTFMVEMSETARILRQASHRSLVVLDEIGRGTSTFDGLSLAWAVIEELASRQDGRGARAGVRTLFATHYHELTGLDGQAEGQIDGLFNMNMAVKEWKSEVIFLRRLVPGPSDRSYGVEVARLAGVPRPVVDRAKDILAMLEARAKGLSTRHGASAQILARQALLPGLVQQAPQPETDETALVHGAHPLLDELAALSPDSLTPLEALATIAKWRRRYLES